jgi:hypothetical protein
LRKRSTFTVVLMTWLIPVAWAAAEPLVVFECREVVGRDWPRTLVTYQQESPRGKARAEKQRLLDPFGPGAAGAVVVAGDA